MYSFEPKKKLVFSWFIVVCSHAGALLRFAMHSFEVSGVRQLTPVDESLDWAVARSRSLLESQSGSPGMGLCFFSHLTVSALVQLGQVVV